MNVFLSESAEKKLLNLNNFLLENWDLKVRNDFTKRLTDKIIQISSQPESCPQSTKFKGIYKCVVTKQTTFYYRSYMDEIEIITVFDTRQNPNKLDKDF